MQSKKGLCVTLLVCANVLIAFACDYNADTKRAGCSSFGDLKAAGSHPEWKKLAVVGSADNKIFTPVRKDTFVNVPNVDDLQVKGLANKLEAGAFNGLNRIIELHFDDNKFGVLSEEPFANIPVQWIYIFNCGVTDIRPNTFKNLHFLTKVDMQGNYLPIIEEGIFTGMRLINLILRRNKIKTVKPNAFGNMVNLQWLSLEENELTSFEPQFALGYTPTLKDLYVNRNKISKISRDMFSVLPNLVSILLNLNQIQRLGDYAFNDLRKLSLLDLSNNHLEEIQTNVFNADGTSDLHVLFLQNNNLTFLSTNVLARLPVLDRLAAGGNPWQCPCWHLLDTYLKHRNITHLCYELYTQGSRPFCVVSDVPKNKHECVYDVDSAKGLIKDYYDVLRDYPPIPPVCNLFGSPSGYLGA